MKKMRKSFVAFIALLLMLSVAVDVSAYSHPGGVVTSSELSTIKTKVDANTSPWMEAYDQMMIDANQALSVTSHAIAALNIPGYYANPAAHDAAKLRLEIDAQAAYAAAVAYQLTGNTVYAEKAKELLNGWAYTNTSISGTDGRLVSAYVGVGLINAADLLKGYTGWSAADKSQFGLWLTNVTIPVWDSITFTSNWRDWSLYAQIASYQFLDDAAAMASEVNQLKTQIDVSIASDGFLPDETTRGQNSLWYHYFALTSMTAAADIVKHATGEDLFNWVSPSGKTIKLALDKMFYYVNGNVSQWPSAYGGGNQSFSNARNLYEAMAEIYQDSDYEDYVRDSRPLKGRINSASGYYHNHAWVYPTLLRTSFPPAPLPGLVGYWNFDETSGVAAADSTGNGLNGTLTGGPVWTAGHTNNALSFDGSDDYVDLGNPSKLRLTGAMSLSAWVYLDSFTSAGRIISKQGPSGSRGWSLNLETDGKASFQIASSGTALQIVNTATAIPANQWVHLVGVYEPGTALRIYVNGVLSNANTTSIAASQYNSNLNVNIGRRPSSELYFEGKIDEVRLYNKSLTTPEVADLAAATDASLVGYWNLDETSGTTAADLSGNGLNGTLVGAPAWTTGHTNNGLDFDGSSDYVNLGNPTALRLTGAMTLSTWVYVDSHTTAGRILSKQGPANNRGWSLNMETDGRASFQIATNSTTLQIVNSAAAIPTGQWVYLAGVYEPGSALRLYVNGSLSNANTTSIAASQYNNSLNVNMGRRPNGELYFDGKIDEVRIYNTAKSAAEITAGM
ncbi:LamG-like jellyroll fold domain-containing protein [Paenibacillus oryzisoli]|uniref:LamG-like jellyroll fold domain-containing protein n=1 Tax=Paenibacillus oryzisoli TaxID=1850517 RepID=UPI003D2C8079